MRKRMIHVADQYSDEFRGYRLMSIEYSVCGCEDRYEWEEK